MASQSVRSFISWSSGWYRASLSTALHVCALLPVVAVGVLGLVESSRSRQVLESGMNIHLLFGLLLAALVLARCLWYVKRSPRLPPCEVHELSRHLSRIVYLSAYAVIGVRQVVSVANAVGRGGAVDFNLFDERFRHGPDQAGFDPLDDFQLFVASIFVVFVFVRVLAFALWMRAVKRAARVDPAAAIHETGA